MKLLIDVQSDNLNTALSKNITIDQLKRTVLTAKAELTKSPIQYNSSNGQFITFAKDTSKVLCVPMTMNYEAYKTFLSKELELTKGITGIGYTIGSEPTVVTEFTANDDRVPLRVVDYQASFTTMEYDMSQTLLGRLFTSAANIVGPEALSQLLPQIKKFKIRFDCLTIKRASPQLAKYGVILY